MPLTCEDLEYIDGHIDLTNATNRYIISIYRPSEAELQALEKESDYYTLRVFCTNYNILRIMSGLSGITYSN